MPTPTGRFAPSPSGRMHLGNIYAALISWLSARSQGGRWLLRIEDIDTQRSKPHFAAQIEDDLRWLGLDWDGHCVQSQRYDLYEAALQRLQALGLTYPCHCTRAEIMATQAPHQSDGRITYPGTCRPQPTPPLPPTPAPHCAEARGRGPSQRPPSHRAEAGGRGPSQPPPSHRAEARGRGPSQRPPSHRAEAGGRGPSQRPASTRLMVPDSTITYNDGVYGPQAANLQHEVGDFVLRRADGAWAYQLAVVVDDALTGLTEVVRGCDLLLSGVQQTYLHRLLGYEPPQFYHLPLLCNSAGQRLSKRDGSMAMDALRSHHSAEQVIGMLAKLSGLRPTDAPISASDLLQYFRWEPLQQRARVGDVGVDC